MSEKSFLRPDTGLVSATFFGASDIVFAELLELANLVGIQLQRIDAASETVGILQFDTSGCGQGQVRARFHELFTPYFAKGSLVLDYRSESTAILELMVAVGATVRGRVLGVIGAHGGAGASSFVLGLARELQRRKFETSVIDLDSISCGLDLLISGTNFQGRRWIDLQGRSALLAGRLKNSLPNWKQVRILSGDDRGGVALKGDQGSKAIAALAQVSDWTLLDLPRSALLPNTAANRWMQWCDSIVIVTRGDAVSLARSSVLLRQLDRTKAIAVIVMGIQSQNQLAHIRQTLSFEQVFGVRFTRGYLQDLMHGIAPGDRVRGNTSRDIAKFCYQFCEVI
ncbi:MAG: hypothetical protein SPG61_01300 [Arcanobacterium sp.]|nr:hypothetical protein [Arcanobacterium sp.]